MRPFPGVVSKNLCDNSVFTRTYSRRVRQQNAVTKSADKLSMSSTEPYWKWRGHNVRPLRKDLNPNLADSLTSNVPHSTGVLLLRLDILHPHTTSTHFVVTGFFPLSSAFASFFAIHFTAFSRDLEPTRMRWCECLMHNTSVCQRKLLVRAQTENTGKDKKLALVLVLQHQVQAHG